MWTSTAAGVTASVDEAVPGRMYSGLFLRSPDDASARLVPHQPRPVVREAEMRRHPVRPPRSLGFSISDQLLITRCPRCRERR
jgi:hypothetical protein